MIRNRRLRGRGKSTPATKNVNLFRWRDVERPRCQRARNAVQFCHPSLYARDDNRRTYATCFVANDATYSRRSDCEVITLISCQS